MEKRRLKSELRRVKDEISGSTGRRNDKGNYL
jgi:hypothetical protein